MGADTRRDTNRPGRGRADAWLPCAALAAVLTLPTMAAASTYQWNVDANGDWNNAANWTVVEGLPGLGYPSAAGDVARFPAPATTANRVITIPNAVTITIGRLEISDDHAVTIQGVGTGTLAFDDTVNPTAAVLASNAAHVIATPVVLIDGVTVTNTSANIVQFTRGIGESGGARTVRTDGIVRFASNVNNTYTGVTTVASGRLELAHTGGTIAIPGDLVIGIGAGPDFVRLVENENIAAGSTVRSNTADAVFDVNGRTETFAHLNLDNGGTVTIGSGVLTVNDIVMDDASITAAAGGRLVLAAAGQGVTVPINNSSGPSTIGGGTLELTAGDHPFQVGFTQNPFTLDITSAIVGPGGITKTLPAGGGTLRLAGTNTYTGPTNVLGGVLLVTGSQPQSAVTIDSSAAELHGTGVVGPVSALEGRIHPGVSGPGVLGTGAFAIGSDQVLYEADLNGTAPGTFDQINVTGSVDLTDGQLLIRRQFDPAPGDTLVIINNDGVDAVVGHFGSLPEGTKIVAEDDIWPFTISYVGGDGNDVVLIAGPPGVTYSFAEGATGGFFDTDLLIANPNDAEAPTVLTFLKEDGTTVVVPRAIPAQSRVTIRVDEIAGLDSTAAAIEVRSEQGLPLAVERTMFWDASSYGGHTESASRFASPTWAFAEGAQGFFDTYFLVQNPHAKPVDITFTFLREQGTPFEDTITVPASSRLTLYAGAYTELLNQAFGTQVSATLPIIAERAMYFGTTPNQLWTGGHASAGTPFQGTDWILAEGATGSFFDTFILLSNPQDVQANVTLTYLLPDGQTVDVEKIIPAKERLTVNIEAEDDPRLHHTAVSTVVDSDVNIVVERSMYWQAGEAQPWGEAHHGVAFNAEGGGERWGLAEGRVGGPLNFSTFILLANPNDETAEVSISYLREAGAPIVKAYNVPATSRFTIDVRALVPELQDQSFGAIVTVTNGPSILVERAMYWDVDGILWAGGTNGAAIRLPNND